MILELLAGGAAAFGAAGIALALRWLSGGRLPQWLVPAMAGGAMIGFAVWSEYSWFPRTSAALPAGVEVAVVNEARAPWRPWTYVVPMTDRFAALDRGSLRKNDAVPGQRIADLWLFARWVPAQKVPMVFDCAGGRHAPLAGASFDATGAVSGASWTDAAAGDPVQTAACREV